MAALDDRIREVKGLAAQRDAAFTAAAAPQLGGKLNLLLTFPIGTRVLDLVTGEEGTIVNGKRENVIVSAPRNQNA